jgi:acetylornithine deacetylase
MGEPAELAGVSYWADASLIAAAGIPTVLYGPPGDGAHASVEWVSISGTVDCARGLLATAQRFCA